MNKKLGIGIDEDSTIILGLKLPAIRKQGRKEATFFTAYAPERRLATQVTGTTSTMLMQFPSLCRPSTVLMTNSAAKGLATRAGSQWGYLTILQGTVCRSCTGVTGAF